MDDLEDYILSKLPEHEIIVAELNQSIDNALDLLSKIDFENKPAGDKTSLWPYWVVDEDRLKFRDLTFPASRPVKRLSQSTTSMIAAAIAAAACRPWHRFSTGYEWPNNLVAEPAAISRKLAGRVGIAVLRLIERWNGDKVDVEKPENDEVNGEAPDHRCCSLSTTFGKNDILTLSWHLDIFHPSSPMLSVCDANGAKLFAQLKAIMVGRIIAYAAAASGYTGVIRSFNDKEKTPKRIVTDSAHNLLRFVRCFHAIDVNALQDVRKSDFLDKLSDADAIRRCSDFPLALATAKDRAFFRFLSKLHDQLSYSSITDSRFDAAELAFCLEGMLHLRPEAVDLPIVKRVMEEMLKSQKSVPYWHTETPMTANQKGQVLYPASVEIARSLLASLSIYDSRAPGHIHQSVGSQYMDLITRYWSWLKTRSTTVVVRKSRVTAWHSERINDAALIHTWETSQILEFLLVFRDQILRHISRNLLVRSRLSVRRPSSVRITETENQRWEKCIEKYENLLGADGSWVQVYRKLGEQFISGHANNLPRRPWSMLLYGPPGTGKSELANNIATALQVPLITITVSDFLAEGEGRMENRAKRIFDILARQELSVVLFDEMDQFILDRDSDRFRQQDSAFQFLTPGMLNKFADLRRAKKVIFVVATNYEERIDAAVKRTGRIDEQYLMLPPNGARRLKILEHFPNLKATLTPSDKHQRQALIANSVFLGYKDMERIADDGSVSAAALVERLGEAPRNIAFFSYKDRFGKVGEQKKINLYQGPRDELIAIFRLADEAWSETSQGGETRRTFRAAMKELVGSASDDSVAAFRSKLKEHGVQMDALVYLEPRN